MDIAIAAVVTGPNSAQFVVDAERLGVSQVWVAEAWGQDAFTPLAYLAARTEHIKLATGIAQLGARTPATLAMSAMSMQMLSGNRFILGLGTSGPQVMEGWHGVRFRRPVQTTRETIEIVRRITSGGRTDYEGDVYRLPLPDSQGRAIRSMLPPVEVPIYVAALGPQNLKLTAELADGWLGNTFMPEHADAFLDHLKGDRPLDLVVPVAVEFTDDPEEAARRHARGYAFTIGAMGSKDQNFYNAAFTRQGFGDDIRAVQELWLAGKREEAADRVPIELGAQTNLLGDDRAIKARLAAYQNVGITTLQAKLDGPPSRRLDTLARLLDLTQN